MKSTNDSALSSNSTRVVPVGLSLGENCMLVSAGFLKCATNLHGCTGIDSHICSLDILDFCLSILSALCFVYTGIDFHIVSFYSLLKMVD
ncbi:hypothetical protein HanXRQr2_Chr11g0514471 [Helianthus annuus]|uniref:Uncharacterized protein n=1 Tax=Helianthus annuus TaxID=4232 RepID=A0A251TET1_HELAN|nr:hypothetical protein HanXRQr2_Chr11g0514471 [Helianthus annuus]KAJ0519207.1 hypothetical protein HanHA89_Chr11g0446201 [Helianthus annuus]KAJ0877063.1 hypothetical protein HanPSC8_Chr11g0495801 [Helianthus annuus]